MSELSSYALIALLAFVAAAAVDALLRRGGFYDATSHRWPVGWRPRSVERSDEASPYRNADRVVWAPVVPAGVPYGVSLFIAPAALLALLWSFAVLLALHDFVEVFAGRRTAGYALASLALCVARALGGWYAIGSALERLGRPFAVACLFTVGLDAALAVAPIPCSDVRADDVRFAAAGLLIHAPLMCAYAWNHWRRRGTVHATPGQAPVFH